MRGDAGGEVAKLPRRRAACGEVKRSQRGAARFGSEARTLSPVSAAWRSS